MVTTFSDTGSTRLARAVPRLFCLVSGADQLALLPALALAGVDGFQVREKGGSTRDLVGLTRHVIGAVRPHGAAVVVNDRLDVALAVGADGVHLGQDDLPVAAAHAMAPNLLVGATCRDRGDCRKAVAEGASYAGFGPLFATTSKDGLPDPLGPQALTGAAGLLPLIGIGGVDAAGAKEARDAGAHGVAVIGAIWRQPDPLSAAEELVRAVA